MKKLAALAMLLALTLTACGDNDSDKDSSEKDDKETTSQNENPMTGDESDDEGETPESDGRPSVDEIVALFEKGEKASGMEMPDTLKKCMAEGLYDSELTDEQVNDYLAAKADKETTDLMVTVTKECSGL